MKKGFLLLLAFCMTLFANAQVENSTTEVIDYRDTDGKIILTLLVNGVEADFLLDLSGHNAILPEYMDKFKIDKTTKTTFNGYNQYLHKKVEVDSVYTFESISLGNNIFGNEVKFFLLKNDEPYLKELGVAGVVNNLLFLNSVLTIDTKRKKITTTSPYRPSYMKLDHRASIKMGQGQAVILTVNLNGVDTNVLLDTWDKGVLSLNSADYAKFSPSKEIAESGLTGVGYNKDTNSSKQMKGDVKFVKETINGVLITENNSLTNSIAGLGLLEKGLLSIDFGKEKVYFQPHDLVAINDNLKIQKIVIEEGKLNAITRDWFVENIYDYKKGGDFVSKYTKPVVIDFWATWCGPCMKLLPQMETFAAKYKDKIVFLKVNADKEKELCNKFNVQALPTILFIPPGGKPKVEVGATPEKYLQLIEEMIKESK